MESSPSENVPTLLAGTQRELFPKLSSNVSFLDRVTTRVTFHARKILGDSSSASTLVLTLVLPDSGGEGVQERIDRTTTNGTSTTTPSEELQGHTHGYAGERKATPRGGGGGGRAHTKSHPRQLCRLRPCCQAATAARCPAGTRSDTAACCTTTQARPRTHAGAWWCGRKPTLATGSQGPPSRLASSLAAADQRSLRCLQPTLSAHRHPKTPRQQLMLDNTREADAIAQHTGSCYQETRKRGRRSRNRHETWTVASHEA